MEKIVQIDMNGINYTIYGTIRGLVSEKVDMESIFQEKSIDFLMLGISKEELEGLEKYIQKPFDVDLSDYEVIYGLKLKEYGDVKMPVPSFTSALRIALENNIPVEAIDMDEKEYSDLFVEEITTFQLLRHSLRKSKLFDKNFHAKDAEEFSIMWDMELNKIKGFKNIEEKREKYMAKKILDNNMGKNVLVVVDYPRLEGIIEEIKK